MKFIPHDYIDRIKFIRNGYIWIGVSTNSFCVYVCFRCVACAFPLPLELLIFFVVSIIFYHTTDRFIFSPSLSIPFISRYIQWDAIYFDRSFNRFMVENEEKLEIKLWKILEKSIQLTWGVSLLKTTSISYNERINFRSR